jgi:hypothetical protein
VSSLKLRVYLRRELRFYSITVPDLLSPPPHDRCACVWVVGRRTYPKTARRVVANNARRAYVIIIYVRPTRETESALLIALFSPVIALAAGEQMTAVAAAVKTILCAFDVDRIVTNSSGTAAIIRSVAQTVSTSISYDPTATSTVQL